MSGAPVDARATARLLKALEARLVALDEALLLATAFLAPPPAPEPPRPRARVKPRLVLRPHADPPARRRPRPLRFAALPAALDRVVIQNWNAETGYVPIGEVELELDPGQAVTLWVNRASPTPAPRGEPAASTLVVLSDDPILRI